MSKTPKTAQDRLDALLEDGERLLAESRQIEDTWGSDRATWPAGQVERHDRLATAIQRNAAEVERVSRWADDMAEAKRTGSFENERTQMEAMSGRRGGSDPWSPGTGDDLTRLDSPTGLRTRAQSAVEYAVGLPTHGRALLADIVDREGHVPQVAALVLAATADAYGSAFRKVIADPTAGHLTWTEPEREAYSRAQAARAAMSTSDSAGGFLLPFALDPTVIITSTAQTNPLRAVARKERTLVNEWNGVASAGVTAEWLAEGTEAADGSPTFGRLNIPVHKVAAYVTGSFEILADSNVVSQLPRLVGDAFDQAEAEAFVTGSGSGEPTGLVTTVAATTASRVSATTGGSFAVGDVYAIDNSLPTRARAGRPVWLANRAVLNSIRQMDTYGGSSFWSDLTGSTPARLLGSEVYEASAMDAAITTGSTVALLGDASEYLVVDRLGTTLVYSPAALGSNRRPTYSGMWMAYRRVGGDVSNVNAFRTMTL